MRLAQAYAGQVTEIQLLHAMAGGAPERSGPLATSPTLVADAGFDEFIRRYWDTLVPAGEALNRIMNGMA